MKHLIFFLYNLQYKDGKSKGFHPLLPALSVSTLLMIFTFSIYYLLYFSFFGVKPNINKYGVFAYLLILFLFVFKLCVSNGYFERNYEKVKANYSTKQINKYNLGSIFFLVFMFIFIAFVMLRINNQGISDIRWR